MASEADARPEDGLEVLALLHLDGLADAGQRQRLERILFGEADARGAFLRLARQHGELAELLKSSGEAGEAGQRPQPRSVRRSVGRRLRRVPKAAWPGLVAAGLALALLGALLLPDRPGAAPARGVAMLPEPAPLPGQPTPTPLNPGLPTVVGGLDTIALHLARGEAPRRQLRTGDRFTVRAASATLAYADGTRVAVAKGSRLSVPGGATDEDIALLLESGTLEAEVAPQRASHAMHVATPHALLEVVGTRFLVTSTHGSSRLEVAHGSVRMTGDAEKGSALVAAGQVADTARGGPLVASLAPAAGAHHGLRGEYYDNMDFTESRFTRIDPVIDFNWGTGSPGPGIAPETFSVRWSGFIQADFDEDYTFTSTMDDGVRLYIDGQLVIDRWGLHMIETFSGAAHLHAGRRVPIVMEFYQDPNYAQVNLLWSSRSQTQEIVPESHLFTSAAE